MTKPNKYITVEIEKTIQQSQWEPLKIKVGVPSSSLFDNEEELKDEIDEFHGTLHEVLKGLFKKHNISKKYREAI